MGQESGEANAGQRSNSNRGNLLIQYRRPCADGLTPTTRQIQGNRRAGRVNATGVKVIGFVAEEFDERNREALFAFFDLVSI